MFWEVKSILMKELDTLLTIINLPWRVFNLNTKWENYKPSKHCVKFYKMTRRNCEMQEIKKQLNENQ
jgi:hypothetical protein